LLFGQGKDGLYVFSESFTMFLPQAFFFVLASPLMLMFWHRRLGHPNSRVLSLVASNKKVTCTLRPLNFQCPACLLGKSSCLSLGSTGHKTSTPFELIFNDV
jgi:hypothetical protein